MQPAHIVDMGRLLFYIVLGIGIVLFLLFFPIIFRADQHFDLNKKKMGFAVFLYGKLKLIGGYAKTYEGGLALHISPKKAIVIPYAQMNNERKRFSIMKTFHLRSFILTVETGAEYLFLTSLIHVFLRTYFFARGGEKENIENNLWLTDGDILRVSLTFTVRFNLFILICDFIQFIKEKLKTIWRKKTKKSIA